MKPWEKYSEKEAGTKPWEKYGTQNEAEEGPDLANAPEQSTGEFAAGAAMDLAESALGVGDEVGAAALSVRDFFETGEWNWSENLDQARLTLDTFDAQNPNLSGAITAAGVAGSLLIPAAGAAKLAQTGSRLARASKIGAVTSAEGAAYGALAGRGEEGRLEGAMLGAAIGGVAGAGVSLLLRNTDEIAEMAARDSVIREAPDQGHIAGKGFVNAAENKQARDPSKASADSSTKDRQVDKVYTPDEYDELPSRSAAEGEEPSTDGVAMSVYTKWFGDTKNWIVRNVGERAAKLTEDAEWMGRTSRQDWLTRAEEQLAGFDDVVEQNPRLFAAMQNLGRGKQGTTWIDVYEAGGPEMKDRIDVFKTMYDDLKALDAPDRVTDNWIHTAMLPKSGREALQEKMGVASKRSGDGTPALTTDYMLPVRAMLEYVDEVTTANALAERFGIMMADVPVKKNQNITEQVIKTIRKRAGEEGASKDVQVNLEDALRSVFISSKAGGDAVGAQLRKLTSTAYLGSPANAVLNVSEWVTPAAQNGMKAWAAQVPRMIQYAAVDVMNSWGSIGKYSLPKIKHSKDVLTPEDMGLGEQFMGELAAQATNTATMKLEGFYKFVYDKMFVGSSNRTGQFSQLNSAVNKGTALAKRIKAGGPKGQKALEEFRASDGARGLTEDEITKTIDALASRDVKSGWLRNYAGASLNMYQPVSGTALPRAVADHPDARVMYSMLTYMNRQQNAMREQIGGNFAEAYRRGINTPEGARAAKKGMMASAKYTAYYGVFSGLWERYRSSLDESRDIDFDEVMTPEGIAEATLAQMASNLTSGLVDVRADQYGRGKFNMVPAPLTYASDVGSGLLSGIEGVTQDDDQSMTEFYRMLQGNVPLVSGADKAHRLFNEGERLLVQPEDR